MPSIPSRTARPRWVARALAALTLAALVVFAASSAGTRDLPLPGPAPRARLEPVAGIGVPSDERCADCHREIAAEQRASLHRRSWQNGYFTRSYALEPGAFCRKCHAPEADPSAEPPLAAREAGVGCVTCHAAPSGVLGVHGLAAREGAHEVIPDARLDTPAACGGCHQFALPSPPRVDAGPMQDTLCEHARSAAATTTCQGCHMPPAPSRGGGTHRSHAFRVQGDVATLASAVVVSGAELRTGEVRLSLAPGAVGHAFPTGDLLRRVEVRAAAIDAGGHVLAAGESEVLGRTFGARRFGHDFVKVQQSDTRLDGPRTVVLRVPPQTRRARWQIVWQRLPPSLAARLGMVMSEHEKVVLEGVVSR